MISGVFQFLIFYRRLIEMKPRVYDGNNLLPALLPSICSSKPTLNGRYSPSKSHVNSWSNDSPKFHRQIFTDCYTQRFYFGTTKIVLMKDLCTALWVVW